ncbi:MAG: ribonuclease Y [bacterium]
MTMASIVAAMVTAGLGVAAGYLLRKQIGVRSRQSLEHKIEHKLKQAKDKVTQLRERAEKEAREIRNKAEGELDERRQQIIELEKRVADREDILDGKLTEIEKKEVKIEKQEERLVNEQETLTKLRAEEEGKLTEIAGLSSEQAEARVLELAEQRTQELIVQRVRKLDKEGEKRLDETARDILSTIIQRYASSHVSETTTSHVHVEDESLIGRVIGKEGRNIQHLERLTGCEIIVDETPNSIMISGFSPIRRQVAKKALERLMADGRIHPGRIEEIVEEAKSKINDDMKEAGEAVVYDLGVVDFPEQLVQLLGRLKYRTSYRQNVLKHSWEATHIATMLAQELGADVKVVKKAALLHDIGKAIDHEVEGDHVEVGVKIMKKFGIDEKIINAAAEHHKDPPYTSIEALIVQVADAISAARPGARRDTAENYIKRMEDLENIATSYEGVKKAYAIYAGRELRVFVEPKDINDLEAIKLAQSIARQIEQELKYPGEVKVNVIRETRAEGRAR